MSENTPVTEKKKRSFDTYNVVVEETVDLTPRNKAIRFQIQEEKTIEFKAGQFVQMFIPHEEKIRRTSYSIASPPTINGSFELCVTRVDGGISSNYLHGLKVGDKIQSMGPLGRFSLADENKDSVFICTGSGVAPFRSMILDQLQKKTPKNLYLLFGNRYEGDIIYEKEWKKISQEHKNFQCYFTLSRADWDGPKGYVQDHISKFLQDVKGKNFYICGLNNMINAVQEKLLSLNIPQDQIHFERYD